MTKNKKYLISFIVIMLFLFLLLFLMTSYENGDEGVIYYPEVFEEAEVGSLMNEQEWELVEEVSSDILEEDVSEESIADNLDSETSVLLEEDDSKSRDEFMSDEWLKDEEASPIVLEEDDSSKMMIVIERN